MTTQLSLVWTDDDGTRHTVGLEGATRTLAKFYERWPGGWSEVEAEDLARSKKEATPYPHEIEMPQPDIYVGDTGHAWAANINPDLADDPSFHRYYSAERMQRILNTSTATIIRLKTLLNQAYSSVDLAHGLMEYEEGFHDGFGNATKRAEEKAGTQASLSWNGFNLHGDPASIKEAVRLVHEAGMVPELKQMIAELQSSKRADGNTTGVIKR